MRRTAAEMCPNFPVSAKPDGWAEYSLAVKLEVAFGCAVDRAMDYLLWPPEQCNPHMLAAQKEAVMRMLAIGAKFAIENSRAQERAAALTRLAEEMMVQELNLAPEDEREAELAD